MFKISFRRISKAAALAALILPFQFSPALAASKAAQGRQVYNTYCVLCHGSNMVNAGSNAPDLRKFPKSQKARFVKSVKNGKGQGKMPAWGDILSAEDINKIWSYVKTRGKI
ncbi:MAG: cytochrome c [Rhodospirillaceae bacterium]|jgi:mono/diheme cytochrome c family protein|nr:cytochrome c [Rhodospirillaceae bacterium]MBT5895362.1 cytochrome c [Rhodospirillaceae bacterium]MBT6427267.1 cytochrome c [Rhodospirillaceae bacterium]MBT7758921.1 cytochrome c [Rhodospirillaceae bacterium]